VRLERIVFSRHLLSLYWEAKQSESFVKPSTLYSRVSHFELDACKCTLRHDVLSFISSLPPLSQRKKKREKKREKQKETNRPTYIDLTPILIQN
jgi:hypothetical protein